MSHYVFLEEATHTAFVEHAAKWLTERMTAAIAQDGACIVGLCGGTTPMPVYRALAGSKEIDWQKVQVFLTDERCVPPEHLESNQHLIREGLRAANIPERHFHFPDTRLPMDACLLQYARDWKTLCSERLPHVVVLGMGTDGHTASLFPPLSTGLLDDSQLLAHTTAPAPFAIPDRITFAANPLAAADATVLLIEGAAKRTVWDTMLSSTEDAQRWPLKRVMETGNLTTIWSPGA